MKTCVSIGLLVLLLAHSMGWSVAVLCPGASTPEADRSVVTGCAPSAWQRFAELSEKMLEMDLAKTPPTPLGTILKMLNDIAKAYLPVSNAVADHREQAAPESGRVGFKHSDDPPEGAIIHRTTPPPEMIG